MAQWKKFTGSEEQISEILNAKYGIRYKRLGGDECRVSNKEGGLKRLIDYSFDLIKEYMLCQPHPHDDMIIEWARTGRDVYELQGMVWVLANFPEWIPHRKYSFNPDNESSSSCHGESLTSKDYGNGK